MDSTSATLLERLKTRADNDSWERFVALYTPFLYGCGLKFGLVEGDAADVVQEVFLLLFDKLPQFQRIEGGSFRGWLKTVMLNKCREIHRQRHETAVGGSGAGLSGIADDGSVDLLWDREYRQSLIARAFEVMRDEFEPNTWQACWQHIAENRPAAEVAANLGISTAAVYTYSSRVLKTLRRELQYFVE